MDEVKYKKKRRYCIISVWTKNKKWNDCYSGCARNVLPTGRAILRY